MKGIKFRVWDKVANKWLDYEEIYFDQEGEVYLIEERTWAYQSYMHKENITEKVEVVRFTGLKDKNGKEIYEGDVLKFSGNVVALGIVKYNENFATFQACNGNSGWLFGNESGTSIDIIGNVYENLDLVGASK